MLPLLSDARCIIDGAMLWQDFGGGSVCGWSGLVVVVVVGGGDTGEGWWWDLGHGGGCG